MSESPTTSMYEAGQTFQRKYVLEEVLGKGGFGTVFRGVDANIGREVAIKVLAHDTPDGYSGELRHRFRTEAAAVAKLSDPHSVTLLDYGESDERFLYLLFEFVNGTSLHSRIQQDGPVPPHIALVIVRQVLLALREAHLNGILHRDVKPDNVIIYEHMGDPFRAKLVDFGLAKQQYATPDEDITKSGALVGTPRYMSPEALFSRPLTPASDLFSLGLVLYEMVVGEPANHEPSPLATATKMCSPEEFTIPSTVPPELAGLLQRLLRKQPQLRFQTADEVLAHLDALRAPPPSASSGPVPTLPMPPVRGPDPRQTSSPTRELDAADFGAEASEPLELARVDRREPTVTVRSPVGDAPAAEARRGDGTLGFAVIVFAVLAAASAGAIWYFDIEMPWNEVEPVSPSALSERTFDVTAEDTIAFWVDASRGIVLADAIGSTPAVARCAMILDSRSSPTPPGAYYLADLVDRPPGPVVVAPVGKEALIARAAVCDDAGEAAEDIVLSAEILAVESRAGLGDDEPRTARKAARKKRRRVVIENLGVDSAPTSQPTTAGSDAKRDAFRKALEGKRGSENPMGGKMPAGFP